MRRDRQLGLDELMIVNPSSLGPEAMFLGQIFMGEDGSLYQVQGFDSDGSSELGEGVGEDLGEDDVRALGQYFLGADGVLYEVVR